MTDHAHRAPLSDRLAFHPAVEVLEDRSVPASLSLRGSTLTVTGDSLGNRVSIRDNGNGDLRVSITGRPARTGNFANVRILRLRLSSGNDRVVYIQEGPRTRSLLFETDLGTGSDVFFADVLRPINPSQFLEIVVRDSSFGAENDVIEVQAGTDVDIRSGGLLRVDLRAGTGRDRIDFNYRGEIDGALSVVLDGGSSDDRPFGIFFTRATVRAYAGSTGAIMPSLVAGGSGDDHNLFTIVKDDPNDPLAVAAVIDGGAGRRDVGVHTANVLSVRNERNLLV